MSNARLYIQGQEIPLLNDIDLPITYTIEDVAFPDKTSASIAQTIELPGGKEIDVIFENLFDPASDLQYFNPNLKTGALLMVGEFDFFRGSIRINKVMHSYKTGVSKYICDFIGEKADLFHEMGEKYLYGNTNPADDLDFSDYDHAINKTNIANSWATSNIVSGVATALVAGTGYRYALIDYGHENSGNNGGGGYTFYVHHLRPVLFAREYLSKIFTAAGKTWTSTFLDSAFFKTIVVTAPRPLLKQQSVIDANSFYVGTTGMHFTQGMTYAGGGFWNDSAIPDDVLTFDDETTAPLTDTGGIWNNTVYEATLASNGSYNFSCAVNVTIEVRNTGSTAGAQTAVSGSYYIQLRLQKKIGGVWTNIYNETAHTGSGGGAVQVYSGAHSLSYDVVGTAGEKYRIILRSNVYSTVIVAAGPTTITNGSTQRDTLISNVSSITENTFRMSMATAIDEGDTLEINQCIPKMKQKDFLKGIVKAFQLYIYEDKTTPGNYFIEPRKDFYSTTVIDWTDKLDVGYDVESVLMASLDAKRYLLQFTEDGDYFNKTYQDNWSKIYGRNEYAVENQFLTSETEIKSEFSPTPMVGTLNSVDDYLILPHIYTYENSEIKPFKANPRLLIWSGLIDGRWDLHDSSGANLKTQVPYAGSLDDPKAPTFDLNYGVPDEIYIETYPAYTWPTSNLSTEYWNPFLDSISDKNSRKVIMRLILTVNDILAFDFRNPVTIKGVKYVVNKINDFSLNNDKGTIVELIKV